MLVIATCVYGTQHTKASISNSNPIAAGRNENAWHISYIIPLDVFASTLLMCLIELSKISRSHLILACDSIIYQLSSPENNVSLTNLIKQIVPESIIEKKDEDETTFEAAEKEFEETLIPLPKMTSENNNEINKGSE